MKANIRYFTGTGNTARVLGLINTELQAAGWTVDSQETFRAGPASATQAADLLIVGHPALGFGAPEHLLRWLRQLPAGSGCPAAIISVCGATVANNQISQGNSLYASLQIGKILRRKGYKIIAAQDISLPINWTQVSNPPAADQIARILEISDPQAQEIGRALAALRGTIQPRGITQRWLGAVVSAIFRLVGRRFLGKIYQVDDRCNGCSVCALSCPAAAIHLKNKRPKWNLDCAACNRCINICPQQAIQTSAFRLIFHVTLNIALLIGAIPVTLWLGQVLGVIDQSGGLTAWPNGSGVSRLLASLVQIAAVLVLFLGFSFIQLGPLDSLVNWLGRTSFGRRLLSASWTKNFRRYRAPGFRP